MEVAERKLPEGWTYTTLGEVAEIEMGQSPPGSATNIKGLGIPLIGGASDFADGNLRASKYTTAPTKICQKGDLILCIRATIGKASFAESQFCLGRGVAGIRMLWIEPAWVMHYLEASQDLLASLGTGTTFKQVDKKKLSAFPLPLSPSGEQKRIVARIEELQARSRRARESLETIPDLLDQLRQSILAAAFRGDLTRKWREQHPDVEPASELLNRIRTERRKRWEESELEKLKAKGLTGNQLNTEFTKRCKHYEEPESVDATNLPQLPEGWCWTRICDVGDVQLGRQRAPRYHAGNHMRPYLRVQNVFEDRLDLSNVMQMDFPPGDYERFHLKPGDILLNEGQSLELVGRPAMYHGEIPGACFTNTLIRFTPDQQVETEYPLLLFIHYLHTGRFRQEATISTNIAHLGAARFAQVEFPLPPREEQKILVRLVRTSIDWIQGFFRMERDIMEGLDDLEQAILFKAFRGKLVPQDPNDEPASVLLERIGQEKAHQAANQKSREKRKGK